MPSIQANIISGLFRLIGVNKMLDKQGEDFQKLLSSYEEKQKKPLKIPYNKMQDLWRHYQVRFPYIGTC